MASPLRVGLIGLLAAGRSGVPRYTASLVRALDRITREEDGVTFELVTTEAGAATVRPQQLEVRLVGRWLGSPRQGARRVAAEQIAAASTRSEILHFFDLSGPVLAPRRRFVTTIHDAARPRAYKRFVQPWAVRHATAAVAVSAYARDEAARVLNADPRLVTVIHSGPGLEPAEPTDPTSTNGAHARPFLLYVGDLSEHKNLPFLIDVFEAADVVEDLVLVGRPGANYAALRARIDSSPAAGRVKVFENVDDDTLEVFYRGALATVLPSRYEGFGFTPLEAMSRGCPVLASDLPAMREIAGDGAMLLPVGELHVWVDAMRRVLRDNQFAAELRTRGRAVASRYSWDVTARKLCALFRSLA